MLANGTQPIQVYQQNPLFSNLIKIKVSDLFTHVCTSTRVVISRNFNQIGLNYILNKHPYSVQS